MSKSLAQNKADLERYQRQVLAGVDINKDEVESLRNVIAAQEELSRLLGLKDKETSKTNPRIAELETELDLIKTAYNKYQDLLEVMPESQAKEKYVICTEAEHHLLSPSVIWIKNTKESYLN